LDYDQGAPCPIEGAGSWTEGVGIVRNDRDALECDPDGVLKAVRDYEEDCERAELWELEAPEKPNVYVFEYTAYELYGHPVFTVAVDRDAVAGMMQLEIATDADCEKYGEDVAKEYAMWADGEVYVIDALLPNGYEERVCGVYFKDGYPSDDEVKSYVDWWLPWGEPCESEGEDGAGDRVITVRVSDAV